MLSWKYSSWWSIVKCSKDKAIYSSRLSLLTLTTRLLKSKIRSNHGHIMKMMAYSNKYSTWRGSNQRSEPEKFLNNNRWNTATSIEIAYVSKRMKKDWTILNFHSVIGIAVLTEKNKRLAKEERITVRKTRSLWRKDIVQRNPRKVRVLRQNRKDHHYFKTIYLYTSLSQAKPCSRHYCKLVTSVKTQTGPSTKFWRRTIVPWLMKSLIGASRWRAVLTRPSAQMRRLMGQWSVFLPTSSRRYPNFNSIYP